MAIFTGASRPARPAGPYDYLVPFREVPGKWLPVVRDRPSGAMKGTRVRPKICIGV